MAIKVSLGKLDVGADLAGIVRQQLTANRLRWLPIELVHTVRVAALPWHHRDPFDRLLVAQCLHEDLILVSADAAMRAYDLTVLW
jgi:PIN domain nuclease of toxin-antitoxin system